MDNELQSKNKSLSIDSLELLSRFVSECKETSKKHDYYPTPLCSADILTAIYYFRIFPDINEFLEKIYKCKNNYFQLQWVRSMWQKFNKLNEQEVSELVIKQINSVANFTEQQ